MNLSDDIVDAEPITPPKPSGPIVPAASVASRALFFVIAIMAFLACVTVGAVSLVAGAAAQWQSEISREVTIQIRPVEGLDLEAAVGRALEVLADAPGVSDARALSHSEIRNLLEPWLGVGADLDELPVPRLILVEIDQQEPPDFARLRQRLVQAVPTASLDGHDLWQERLRVMAATVVVSGTGVLGLVLAATVLSVVFATRGAMASNRSVVEVLHLVGAKEAFIARQFERHFLRLGLKGGFAGGVMAIFAFAAVRWATGHFGGPPAESQFDALFGSVAIGWTALVGIVLTVLFVAILTAVTSRIAVFRFLRVFD